MAENKNHFAKLFFVQDEDTKEEHQLLVIRETDNGTVPVLRLVTDYEGVQITAAHGFKKTDAGEESRNKAFDNFDQQYAQEQFLKMITVLKEG